MTFDEWLDEIEVYGSRMERLMDDINSPHPSYNDLILKWLRAAYDVGYEEGKVVGSAGQPWLRTYDGKLK
jgi:hypothetical protein